MSDRYRELDEALRALTAGEPPEGFEARLRARLAAEPRPRNGSGWRWAALALGGAAALLIALTLAPPRVFQAPLPPRPAPPTAPFIATAPPTAARAPRRPRRRILRLAVARRRFPPQFPSPAPPSAEERALLRFVRTAPPAVVAAFAKGPDTAPLKIAAIEILPLAPSPGENQP